VKIQGGMHMHVANCFPHARATHLGQFAPRISVFAHAS
jgi:hypothetical protein